MNAGGDKAETERVREKEVITEEFTGEVNTDVREIMQR